MAAYSKFLFGTETPIGMHKCLCSYDHTSV